MASMREEEKPWKTDLARKSAQRRELVATEVEEELEKNGENVLPLNTLKKLEEIEKLARKIRDRVKQ